MRFLTTIHQRKSLAITLIFMVILWASFRFLGLTYLDPPKEYGVAIDFGAVDFEGDFNKDLSSPSGAKSILEEEPSMEIPDENLLRQSETVALTAGSEQQAPQPSERTRNVLSSLLKGSTADNASDEDGTGTDASAEGADEVSRYYANESDWADESYLLSGRDALSRPIVKPNCNEEGVVFVGIEVDNSGKVVRAVPGIKGTTNTAPCLLKPAREAALQTRWNSDAKAPEKQIGIIVYKFSLSE